jgi:hypothetical protein
MCVARVHRSYAAALAKVPLCSLGLALLLSLGCTTLRLGQPAADKSDKDAPPVAPCKRSLRVSQFVFMSDFELNADAAIFKDLEHMRDQVYKELELPSANTIVYVYLFQDRERYDRFMKSRYPDLPERRAFFVAQPRSVGAADDLLVYTYWGDRVQQDLRHELTHALLHSVLKDVPLWLDEGLAEFYETPAEWQGVNYKHLDLLRRGPFTPDLARLEQLSRVQDMKPPEYREAWAWVHLMLRGDEKGKEVLLGYLQQLRTNPSPGLLAPRLVAEIPELDSFLQRHLAKLDAGPRSTPTVKKYELLPRKD